MNARLLTQTFSLSVSPAPAHLITIPVFMVAKQIGSAMRINTDGIYGTPMRSKRTIGREKGSGKLRVVLNSNVGITKKRKSERERMDKLP